MTLPLQTLTSLTRQQLGDVFKDPRTLLAFERIQLQVAQIIPATFTAFQNLDFVVTVADPTVPNAHVITAGSNISVTPAAGLVTLKATPSGASGQIQYNNGGTFGAFTTSGDATINTTTGVLTLATVNTNVGTFGDSTHVSRVTLNAKGLATGASSVAIVGLAPVAGGTGQVLTKNSTADYDYSWQTPVVSGGTVTHTAGALTSGQLVFGNGLADIKVGDLSGDVSTSGSGVTTIGASKVATGMLQAGAVTLPKIANASASSKLVGSGASGSGAAYTELTVGGGLAMTGTTLSATGSGLTAPPAAPQGRLTLVSGTPVMATDQTTATHVYYTPFVGQAIPIYDGASWTSASLTSDLDMALDATNQLGGGAAVYAYDLFAYLNSGTLSIGCGPAWSRSATITVTIASPAVVSWTGHGLAEGAAVIFTTSGALPTGITAGTIYFVGRSPGANSFNLSTSVVNAAAGTFINTSGSQSGTHTGVNHSTTRGTGAGTTELQRKNGLWTNANSITLTNGPGAGVSVAANQATYLGSIMPTTNGQVGMAFRPAGGAGGSVNVGANIGLFLYNAYNRVATTSRTMDTTVSWNYASSTWRATDASPGNRVYYLDGLAESFVDVKYNQTTTATVTSAGVFGVNQDSTTATPATVLQSGNAAQGYVGPVTVIDSFTPALGMHYIQEMEATLAGTQTSFGLVAAGRQSQAMWVGLNM